MFPLYPPKITHKFLIYRWVCHIACSMAGSQDILNDQSTVGFPASSLHFSTSVLPKKTALPSSWAAWFLGPLKDKGRFQLMPRLCTAGPKATKLYGGGGDGSFQQVKSTVDLRSANLVFETSLWHKDA